MTQEKIFERPNGNQAKVSVWLYTKNQQVYWGYTVEFRNTPNDSWMQQFGEYARSYDDLNNTLGNSEPTPNAHYITPEEILLAKIELWESLKPQS